MHYKNGREAKVGDKVFSKDSYGSVQTGTVVIATPGCDTCNLQIVPPNVPLVYVSAKDCLHVDDVTALPALPEKMETARADDPQPAPATA